MSKISVIMPVHNEPENILKPAIKSILNQTYSDFEFIIINDASTTNVEDVIFSFKDERIRYYKNEQNLGVVGTLNRALDLVTGEYIARMDADDISFKTRFAEQVKVLDENEEIGLVATGGIMHPSKQRIQAPQEINDLKYLMICYANCVIHPSVMFRKKLVEEFDLKYSDKFLHAEDYFLWLQLIFKTNFYTIQKPLILYRKREESVSNQNLDQQIFNANVLKFKCILKELAIDDLDLEDAYSKYLRTQTVSLENYIKIDSIYNQIMKKIAENTELYWKRFIINYLNEQRQNLYNSVDWNF